MKATKQLKYDRDLPKDSHIRQGEASESLHCVDLASLCDKTASLQVAG